MCLVKLLQVICNRYERCQVDLAPIMGRLNELDDGDLVDVLATLEACGAMAFLPLTSRSALLAER